MQSEWIYKVPLYTKIYMQLIEIKSSKYLTRPPFLEIMVTDICNASCIMCRLEVYGGKTIMPDELYERIILQAEEMGIQKMILTGGEPFIDKRIFHKIRFSKGHGFKYVHMFTNGELLSEEHSRQIIESGLDSLTISMDSAIKEEYERVRTKLHFDKVVGNIQRLIKLKQELAIASPLVRINMVALPENKRSRDKFIRFFGNLADIAEIMDSHNWAGETAPYGGDEYQQVSRFPCHLLFQKAVVDPSGILKKCSIDYTNSAKMSDLNHISLREALTYGCITEIKKRMLLYDFSIPGCTSCNHKESWWVDY